MPGSPFYGSRKMSNTKFYCESEWHYEVADGEPPGPIREGRWQVSVDGTDWPKTTKRAMRIEGGGGNVFVKFPDGLMRPLPGRVCTACLEKLQEVLRPSHLRGQESML